MNLNDTLKQAIEKLNKLLIKQADEPTLNTATLADGTQIKYPGELAVDTPIIVVTAEGEIPAPDGEHTLEDGTIVKTADGKVTEILAVQAETKVEQAEISDERIIALEAKIDAIGKMLASILPAIESDMKKKEEVMQSLKNQLEIVKAMPVAQAAQVINEPIDPIKAEAERIAAIQSKTKTRK